MPENLPQDGAELHGDFFGAELSLLECETLAIQHIERKHYQGAEPALFHSKWFDYRRLHPTKATYLYADCYLGAYRKAMQTRFDLKRGEFMYAIKGCKEEIFDAKQRDYTGLWKGRQAADSLGVPYDFYCHSAMRWAEENNWRYLPRPSQMYSANVRDWIGDEWQEHKRVAILLPHDERYLAENYQGHQDQNDFHSYLRDLVNSRVNPQYILHQLVVRDRVLPETTAVEMFGEALVATCLAVDLF